MSESLICTTIKDINNRKCQNKEKSDEGSYYADGGRSQEKKMGKK